MTVLSTIQPVSHDLGAFTVRRVLPSPGRVTVGPFVFVDQFGPAILHPGVAMDVRPHPHIGIATVTWLFEGAIDHRDSLGTFATIRPGQVNLMTAGRGIVHSERGLPAERELEKPIYGMQTWLALPDGQEEIAPAFEAVTDLPLVEDSCVSGRVMLLGGAALGSQRHVWWNFVSSSRDRINQAKSDWREGRFDKVPGDEDEFIPIPEVPLTNSDRGHES